MKEIEWSEESLDDLAALDKGMARRIKKAVERFAETGAGNVKELQGIAIRRNSGCASVTSVFAFTATTISSTSSVFATAKTLTAKTTRSPADQVPIT